MYAYFDVDERTLLTLRRLVEKRKASSYRDATLPVYLGLSDEEGFPHEGTINFADNQGDVMTGTLKVRGEFRNESRLLSPGMFARIRLPIGTPHKAILVAERALCMEQGQRFVYVVNNENVVEYRKVTMGSAQGMLRVVEDGVKLNDHVVVNGLQRIRQGSKVESKLVDMMPKDAQTVAAGDKSAPAKNAKDAKGG
jgi:RND family efflux transporter MFP subunit